MPPRPMRELGRGRRRMGMSRRSGIRFADKDMRQHRNLRRYPFMLDHRVIQHEREML
jgi:hypothetical protein